MGQIVQDYLETNESKPIIAFFFANVGVLVALMVSIITGFWLVGEESRFAAVMSIIFATTGTLLLTMFIAYGFVGWEAGTLDPFIVVPYFAADKIGNIPLFWVLIQVLYFLIYSPLLYLYKVQRKTKTPAPWS